MENAEEFIDLATRRLQSKPAALTEARAELMDRLQHSQPDPDGLEAAVRSLRKSSPKPWRGLIASALYIAVPLLVGAVVILANLWEFDVYSGDLQKAPAFLKQRAIERELSLIAKPDSLVPEVDSDGKRPSNLEQMLNLAMFGPPDDSYQARQLALAQSLRAAAPDDVLSFRNEALWSWQVTGKLPENFESERLRLDPDNGIFLWIKAAVLSKQAVKQMKRGYEISDPAKAAEVLEIYRQAASSKKFDLYDVPERRRISSIFRRPATAADLEWINIRAYGKAISPSDGMLNEALQTMAQDYDKAGDAAGLKALIRTMIDMARKTNLQPGAEVPGIISSGVLDSKLLTTLATHQGLSDEVTAIADFNALARKVSRERWTSSTGARISRSYEDGLKSSRYPAIEPAEDAGKPNRLTEYARWDFKAALTAGVAALVVTLALVFEAYRRKARVRSLAGQLIHSVPSTAYLRIVVLGLAVPIAWWSVLIWHTPLGCRDVPFDNFEIQIGRVEVPGMPWLGQMISGFVLLMVATLVMARRERGRSLGFIGLQESFAWVDLVILVLAALAPGGFGLIRYADKHASEFFMAAAAVACTPILWLLWRIGAGFLSATSSALGEILSARLLAPAYALIGIAGFASALLFLRQEKHWMALDPFIGYGGLSPILEADRQRAVEAIRQEFSKE